MPRTKRTTPLLFPSLSANVIMRLIFFFFFFFVCGVLFTSHGFYYPVKYEFMAWRIQYRCFREIQLLDFNEILSVEFYV